MRLSGFLVAVLLVPACSDVIRVTGRYEWKGTSAEDLLSRGDGQPQLTALLQSAGETEPASLRVDFTDDHRFTLRWHQFGETTTLIGDWSLHGEELRLLHDSNQPIETWPARLEHAHLEGDRLILKGRKGAPDLELTRVVANEPPR